MAPPDRVDLSAPLDQRDYSRRTLLASERTYLAWWRTGLTALTVALAAARVVPELAGSEVRWPYVVLGVGFALLGVLCLVYGELRRAALDRAIRQGAFEPPSRVVSFALSAGGALLGLGILAVVVVGP